MTTCVDEVCQVIGTVIAIDAQSFVSKNRLMDIIFKRAGPSGPA